MFDIEMLLIYQATLKKLEERPHADRQGTVLKLVSKGFDGKEFPGLPEVFKRNVVQSLRMLSSLLAEHFSYRTIEGYPYDEFNDSWIVYSDWHVCGDGLDRVSVFVNHKYWTLEQTKAFVTMVSTLAKLHNWKIVDMDMDIE